MKKTFKYLIPTILASGMLFGCTTNTPSGPVDTTVHVTGISLDYTSKAVTVGDSFTLKATVTPSDATNKDVTWSSSNDTFATVSEAGVVNALKDGTVNITATTVDGNFTATCAVTINPKVVETSKMYVHDAKGLIKEVAEKNDNNFTPLINPLVEDGVTYYNVTLGNEIRVKLEANGYLIPTSLSINGEDQNVDDNGYVTFVADKGDYDFISITPNYRDDTPIIKDYLLDIQNSSHITLKAYLDKDCTTATDSVDQGDVVYFKATSSDDSYFCRGLTYKRVTSDLGGVETNEASYDSSKDVFYFTTPYAYDKKITVYPIEGNSKLLDGNKVVGDYFLVPISGSTGAINSFDETKDLTVATSGAITLRKNNTVTKQAQVKTVYDDSLYTEDYATLIYGDRYLFASDYELKSPFDTYDIMCIQKENSTDTRDMYTVDGERFVINGVTHLVLQVYKDTKLYVSFYINYTEKKLHEDVVVKMLSGEHVYDARAMYTVSEGTNELLGVRYIGEGGYRLRAEIVDPYGVYEDDKGNTLVIPNEDNAVYDNTDFVAVISGTTVTLTTGTRRVVVTINISAKTFTVVSDEEVASSFPNLKGLTFTGKYYSIGDSDEYDVFYDLEISFNNYESESDCKAHLTDHCSYYTYQTDLFVTYDLNTNVITFAIDLESQSYRWITSETTFRARLADGKMTFLSDLNNVATYKNNSIYCEDFHL